MAGSLVWCRSTTSKRVSGPTLLSADMPNILHSVERWPTAPKLTSLLQLTQQFFDELRDRIGVAAGNDPTAVFHVRIGQ